MEGKKNEVSANGSNKEEDKDKKNLEKKSGKNTNWAMQDISCILKHMEDLQNKSEKNMEATFRKAIDESKEDINQNISSMRSTLSTDINEIKHDLSKMETVFNSKLNAVEARVLKVENHTHATSGDTKKIQQEVKTQNSEFDSKIKELKKQIAAATSGANKAVNTLREELDEVLKNQRDMIERQQEELNFWRKHYEREIDSVKTRAYGNSNQIRQHTTQIDGLDSKVRAENLVIEGLPEKENEDDNETLEDLIMMVQKVLPDFKRSDIKFIMRMGKQRKNKKRPRPLLVTLTSQKVREMLLNNAAEIKKSADNRFLWINRDQSENAKRRHALVKACYKLMIKHAFLCSMKGSIITYRKKQFSYESLSLLPDQCTPQWVKSRKTSDGTGLCYFSEHTYCSNFAPATIRHNGCLYTSVEHAYQILKVKDAGYSELAAEMTGMTDPYKIKALGDGITPSKEWKNVEEQIMEELIRNKFQQNEKLRKKLLGDRYSSYYEMTHDTRWATRTRITASTDKIDVASLKGDNLQGQIVTRIKSELASIYGSPEYIPPRSPSKEKSGETEGLTGDTETSQLFVEAGVNTEDGPK